MSVEFRKNRKKWGYRFFLHGRTWKRYAWDTHEEAKNAEAAARTELLNNPPIRTDSLGNVAALYLIDSAEQGRSKWRHRSASAEPERLHTAIFQARDSHERDHRN
jgi:hypothetical protein